MRVMVTGHRGYIGTVMTPMLQSAGHDVVGFDSHIFKGSKFDTGQPDIPELQLDIRDAELEHLEGFDAVIHLAALSNDGLSNHEPETTKAINETAAIRLAELAKKAGVPRFLFSSSCSIYGKAGADPVTENGKIAVVSPYTMSKANVERELAKLADDSFSPTYLRNATAYGVSPCHSFELVLNNLVAWATAKAHVFIKSDGTPWRPTVHVEDISSAFLAALTAPRHLIHNEAFNVGNTDENYSVSELAKIVRDVVNGSRIEYAEGGKPDARSYKVDFSKILKILPDSRPKWSARQGAEQLYDTCLNANLSVEEFEGPDYKRIEYVKKLLAKGQMTSTFRWAETATAKEST